MGANVVAALFFLLYLSPVFGGDKDSTGQKVVNFKRHYVTSTYGDRATRSPRPDAPFCRSVCLNVNKECSSNCYGPHGTAHTTFSTSWIRGSTPHNVLKDDSKKYECIDRCLKQDEDTYVIPNTCERQDLGENDEDESDDAPRATKQTRVKETSEEQDEIELRTLTTKRRCQFRAYRNSTVCKFEDDDPEIAKKVFDANKPKLTLCTGGAVLSGRRGLYTRQTMKSFLDWQDRLRLSSEYESFFQNEDKRSIRNQEQEEAANDPTTAPRRKKRTRRSLSDASEEYLPKMEKRRKRRSTRNLTKRQTSRRSENSRGGKELCVTENRFESPSRAIHRATEQVVDIYFYAGYSQWFEMGSCKHHAPVVSVNVKDSVNVRCGMAMTAHKAYIIIEPDKMKDAHKVKDCGTIRALDKKYKICHDWVYLPSHCKLFHS